MNCSDVCRKEILLLGNRYAFLKYKWCVVYCQTQQNLKSKF